MPTTSPEILQARSALIEAGNLSAKAVLGFDGFVDEICAVVNKRTSPTTYTRVDTIEAFGTRISQAAGLSTNIELVSKVMKLGGNGPIMANALGALGLNLTYIGALGKPNVHPVFRDFAHCCRVISIAEPGHTDALEFADGKVMVGKLETLKDVNWESLLAAIPLHELVDLMRTTSFIATVNWTMLPYMTELWEHLLDDVLAKVNFSQPPIIFFDLADPEKRALTEIQAALRTIQRFNKSNRAILGLNRKEATEIALALDVTLSTCAAQATLTEITQAIARKLNIFGVVVHPTNQAACMVDDQFALVDGPHTSHPRLTTGAGDNFNAGFCLGQVLGFSPQESLIIGVGTSGYYVRNEHSPTRSELLAFLQQWSENCGQDF